ncbi:sugar transferase [Flavobacterium wongokense]|uniref:sugar transferase n=1 Tax=Flavobacterium wongokense TaxID=2910674 RepID=UPI001F17D950|nr:sugar transferase [Flavobacterium sp. WG47]MCF6132688.1 sugar transferase [Flavobacterium sp. WG47]
MKAIVKRVFDIIVSLIALIVLLPIIIVSWLILMIDTQSDGLFFQKRVGQYGKLFTIYKLKTMHPKTDNITKVGNFFRKYKLDELPQFLNVLKGDMSIVGPRPDIEGYYDRLEGENRKVLDLKPGITSEASIKYYNEEEILEQQQDALHYNDTIIFPDKVKMNLDYYYNQSLLSDIKIIFKTIFKG